MFFLSPGDRNSSLNIDIHNVVQAPVFDIRKDNALQVWKYTQDAAG